MINKHYFSALISIVGLLLTNSVLATTLSTTDSAGLRSTDLGVTIIPLTDTRAFGGVEDRGIEHFDISGLSGTVLNASLDIEIYSLDLFGQLDIYDFAGDGSVSNDEWGVGTLAFSEVNLPEGAYHPLSFSIIALLQDYIDAGNSFLSFNYRGPNSRVDFGINNGIGTKASVINVTMQMSVVPVPAAIWLFGTALIGLVGFSRRKMA
jgi:hypothetical protein